MLLGGCTSLDEYLYEDSEFECSSGSRSRSCSGPLRSRRRNEKRWMVPLYCAVMTSEQISSVIPAVELDDDSGAIPTMSALDPSYFLLT